MSTTAATGPTPREAEILAFVTRRIAAFTEAPTRGEIATQFGISRPVAEHHLQALAAKGHLVLAKRWRGIELPFRRAASSNTKGAA